jgi:PilZ domain-containing protein
MDERRANPRARRLKPGKIVLNDGKSVFDCSVRNVSATGACLLVGNGFLLPGEFKLTLDGDTKRCDVIWRRPDRMGVTFRAVEAVSPGKTG